MATLCTLIDRLISISVENELTTNRDVMYSRNRILAMFGENEFVMSDEKCELDLYSTLDELANIAVSKDIIQDSLAEKDCFTSEIMNIFLPAPSRVEADFWANYNECPTLATSTFYKMSQSSNYIKMNRIAKNVGFKADSPYGPLDVTINLSKPEKDPKEIARLKNAPTSSYPKCLLCVENEGYEGTLSHPDRANHRTINLHLNNKDWRMQYSPYLYYNEHCILLSASHEPMSITKNTFYNLLSFVEKFPHYFVGSNADLPIVGGSILSHEHYQGGSYEFPINRATVLDTFKIPGFDGITGEILNWPLTTIKLSGPVLSDIAECTNHIYEVWKTYSDASADILAETEGTRHNTITPVAKKIGDNFVMYVVLRNNRTTDENPLGIFHPHADVHHIKKENIGLIEVMGLAILPGRLLGELEEVKAFVKGDSTEVKEYHLEWAKELKTSYDNSCIDTYVEAALGRKFTRVLEDAGVFKLTETGLTQFKAFISTL